MEETASLVELRQIVADAKREGKKVGFVPTMGALHEGHISLIRAATNDCQFIVTSIFVNPTQFSPDEDLDKYPRPKEQDLKACSDAGVDLVYLPTPASVYPEGYATYVDVEGISQLWEGKHRPTHFRGVTTVVTKLFNSVLPDVAYFGQKDYQQQLVIRRMVADLDMPVEIKTCPTIREPDGLAMSSRNQYLSDTERQTALALQRALQHANEQLTSGNRDLNAIQAEMTSILQHDDSVAIDYAVVVDPDTLQLLKKPQAKMVALIAARVGSTRLIDNMIIEITSI